MNMFKILLALVALSSPVLAAGQEEEVVRLEAWPELEKSVKAQVKTDVARLRKARTPEMSEQAYDGLVGAGPGAAPQLITALGKEKDEQIRASITDVLERITGAAHTRLLTKHFGEKSEHVRRFALRRAAAFPDEGTRAAAEAALDKARNPGKRKQPDPDDVFAAALAATASGTVDGLADLFSVALEDWPEEGAAIHIACTAVRGSEATALMIGHLQSTDRDELLAGLRVLAGCGSKEDAASACAQHLDSNDNGIRIAAINALRGIIDGAPPLPRLSAFDAIEKAQEWKRRVR